MPEYVRAKLTIGGKIRADNLPDLRSAVAVDLGMEPLGDECEGFPEEFMEDQRVVISEDEAENGEFSHIEAWCRTLELTYHRRSDGCAEFAPEEVWWDPSCDGDITKEHILGQDGSQVIPADEVGKMIASYWAAADKCTGVPHGEAGVELAEALEGLIDSWDEVPPFEVLDV